MKTIDELILKICQSIADWFQNWFGADNFFLSKTFLVLYWFCLAMHNSIMLTNPGNATSVVLSIIGHGFLSIILLPMVLGGEAGCRKNPNFKNSCVVRLGPIRSFQPLLVALTTFDFISKRYWDFEISIPFLPPIADVRNLTSEQRELISLLGFIQSWALFFFLYFGSCTPKPPEQGKLAKLMERLSPQPSM